MKRVWLESFAESGSATGQAAGQRASLARALLLLAIGALCLAALVAIAILLFGSFGETEGKILLTVVGIGGYSLLGLAATTALGRAPSWLGPLGLAVSAVGFVLFVALIWTAPEGSLLGRLMGTFLILGVALAHAALLLLLTRRVGEGPVHTIRRATLAASAVLTVMIIVPLLSEWDPSGVYARLMGVVAVLAVLGTLLMPIVWKLAAGAGATKEWTAGAAETDTGASAPIELRYKGRTFVVQAVECKHPTRGFAVAAWEITRAGREPVGGFAHQEIDEDRHAALAFAVRQITLAVDEEDRISQSLDSDRGQSEGRATLHQSRREPMPS